MSTLATPLRSSHLLWGGAAVLVAAAAGAVAGTGVRAAAVVAALVVGAGLVLVYLRHLWVGYALVLLAILPGQFIRLSLGTDPRGGSAVLLTDLLLVALVAAWVLRKLTVDRRFPRSTVTGPLLLFVAVALLSYLAGIPDVLALVAGPVGKPLLVAFLYWGRFVLYALSFLVLLDVLRTTAATERLVAALLALGVLLALGGFVQLYLIPDFTSYAAAAGWDPHQGRLLSSFFDPNFMATFFAMDLALATTLLLDPTRRPAAKLWVALAAAVTFVAFLLTFSRGGLLGLAAGLVLIGLLRAPRAVAVGFAAVVVAVAAVPRFAERITAGLSVDETGVKRIDSWTKAVKLLPAHPLLGVGYNHLATTQDALGTVDEFDVNNRGGVENTLLTVLATTGVLGLLAYLWHLLSLYVLALRTWRERWRSPRVRHLALGTAGALTAVLVASLTLNALLYPFILLQLWALVAVVERQRQLEDVHGEAARAS